MYFDGPERFQDALSIRRVMYFRLREFQLLTVNGWPFDALFSFGRSFSFDALVYIGGIKIN